MGHVSFLKSRSGFARAGAAYFGLVAALSLILAVSAAREGAASEEQEVIDLANLSLQRLLEKPEAEPFRALLPHAKGVFIIPEMPKIGFIVGTGGATGVFLSQYPAKGQWSQPAFFHFALGTVTIQFVPEIWDLLLIFTTDRGMDAMVSGKATLGRDLRFSTDPTQFGKEPTPAHGDFADVYVFAAARDAGDVMPWDGSSLWSVDDWNEAYFGAPLSVNAIVFGKEVDRGGSRPLRDRLGAAVE